MGRPFSCDLAMMLIFMSCLAVTIADQPFQNSGVEDYHPLDNDDAGLSAVSVVSPELLYVPGTPETNVFFASAKVPIAQKNGGMIGLGQGMVEKSGNGRKLLGRNRGRRGRRGR